MSLNKTANIVGIVAGIASIVFGYIQFLYPWPFANDFNKQTFETREFLANPSLNEFNRNDTLRLEETIQLSWTGVTSCDKKKRINEEYQRAFIDWRDKTKSALGGFQFVKANYIDGPVSASLKTEPWPDNSRSCTGSGSINCWIELVRQ